MYLNFLSNFYISLEKEKENYWPDPTRICKKLCSSLFSLLLNVVK